jgi:hypothetical protein
VDRALRPHAHPVKLRPPWGVVTRLLAFILALVISRASATPAEDYADLANQTNICIKGIINEMRNDPGKSPAGVELAKYGNFKIVMFCYELWFGPKARGFNTPANPNVSKDMFDILWRDAPMEMLLEPRK